MVIRIGLIAEDGSDVEVLKILAKKVLGKSVSLSYFVGKGCGPLKRKTPGWCKALWLKGCKHVLLVHDLDQNEKSSLRQNLERILQPAPQSFKAVVIPTEELEAWLLSDTGAISRALNIQKVMREIHHPERISSPKEYMGELIRKSSNGKKIYVNTVHNPLIADQLDVSKIVKKCPSFSTFNAFLLLT